jgi:hypothetical protein
MIRTFSRALAISAASAFVVLGAMSPANADETTGSPETELLDLGGYGGSYHGDEDHWHCWHDDDGLLDGLIDGLFGDDDDYYHCGHWDD